MINIDAGNTIRINGAVAVISKVNTELKMAQLKFEVINGKKTGTDGWYEFDQLHKYGVQM